MAITLNDQQQEQIVEGLRTLWNSCEEALRDLWDRSDDGFEAMQYNIEQYLQLLGAEPPEFVEESEDDVEDAEQARLEGIIAAHLQVEYGGSWYTVEDMDPEHIVVVTDAGKRYYRLSDDEEKLELTDAK